MIQIVLIQNVQQQPDIVVNVKLDIIQKMNKVLLVLFAIQIVYLDHVLQQQVNAVNVQLDGILKQKMKKHVLNAQQFHNNALLVIHQNKNV